MNVEVKWLNLPPSPFIDPFVQKEINRLDRRFPGSRDLGVSLREEGGRYQARVSVRSLGRDWWVTSEGSNVTEGLKRAFDTLERTIGEFKRYTKDKINKRFKRSRDLNI
jgi:ribosome-associated translation inhibitor RaiA